MKNIMLLLSSSLILVGCASTGGELSCKETAFDSCMTISQADHLHRSPKNQKRTHRVSSSLEDQTLSGLGLYVTPWVDKDGHQHSGENIKFNRG